MRAARHRRYRQPIGNNDDNDFSDERAHRHADERADADTNDTLFVTGGV